MFVDAMADALDRAPVSKDAMVDAKGRPALGRDFKRAPFANTSPDLRIAMTFGFDLSASVRGAKSVLGMNDGTIYDEERVFDRSAAIAVAIDARR